MMTLIKSKKFWLCMASIISMGIMLATKQINAVQFKEGFVMAVSALLVSMGIQNQGKS